ncbi:hypothetical protein [Asanoa siamensis]|uniref:hypothetical protein n=1 Tax=Asanoa siamensis TaxID=926357 RepID=UPI001940D9D3|nr:hypothetical protein [Asanoa siamensis]
MVADAPNLADWMQAWGSIAAAITSTIAIVITGALLRHETRARREEKEDARRAQARLVVVEWLNRPRNELELPAVATVRVHNHSQAAIYHVKAHDAGFGTAHRLDRGQDVPPGGTCELSWERDARELRGRREPRVEFIDSSNNRWYAAPGGWMSNKAPEIVPLRRRRWSFRR